MRLIFVEEKNASKLENSFWCKNKQRGFDDWFILLLKIMTHFDQRLAEASGLLVQEKLWHQPVVSYLLADGLLILCTICWTGLKQASWFFVWRLYQVVRTLLLNSGVAWLTRNCFPGTKDLISSFLNPWRCP